MSTILAARYHQSKPQATVMERKGKRRGQRKYMSDESTPHQNVLETAQDKSVKQIVRQNFGKSINSRTCRDNAVKMTPFSQPAIQVRYQNEEHVHY